MKEIYEEAERARREPVPLLSFADFQAFHTSGTRKEFEKPYFERRGRLLALALTMALDDSDAYKETLENLIWEICNEYAWAVPAKEVITTSHTIITTSGILYSISRAIHCWRISEWGYIPGNISGKNGTTTCTHHLGATRFLSSMESIRR
jgi:hypothetical protein